MDELDEANDILGDRDVVYLHCVSKYPAYPSDCNMGRMAYLRDRYARPVGYSDHTVGVAAAQHAISLGARAVEVHVRSDLRSQMWDKSLSDVSSLDIHRLVVEKMMLVHAMGWRENEPRPYVGRWAHGF
jgi:sialic acid synthase SpsE